MRIMDWSSDVCSSDLLRPIWAPHKPSENRIPKGAVMAAMFKSDLFRNFFGGFVLGAVLVFSFGSGDDSLPRDRGASPAALSALNSSPARASAPDRLGRGFARGSLVRPDSQSFRTPGR